MKYDTFLDKITFDWKNHNISCDNSTTPYEGSYPAIEITVACVFSLAGIFSISVFCATIYEAKQFKKKMLRSEALRRPMQPSVIVIEGENSKQIKTHPEARQESSINALLEYYDKLPPELCNNGAPIMEAKRGSRRMSSVFPTIAESEESNCEMCCSEKVQYQEGETVRRGKSCNELLPYNGIGHKDKCDTLHHHNKNTTSSSAQRARKTSSSTQLLVPDPYGTLSRANSNELIDQLFIHLMSEKKNDDGDLFGSGTIGRHVSNDTSSAALGRKRKISVGMDHIVSKIKQIGSHSIPSGEGSQQVANHAPTPESSRTGSNGTDSPSLAKKKEDGFKTSNDESAINKKRDASTIGNVRSGGTVADRIRKSYGVNTIAHYIAENIDHHQLSKPTGTNSEAMNDKPSAERTDEYEKQLSGDCMTTSTDADSNGGTYPRRYTKRASSSDQHHNAKALLHQMYEKSKQQQLQQLQLCVPSQVDQKRQQIKRSESSQSLVTNDNIMPPPLPLHQRNDYHSGMQIYQNYCPVSKARGSAGSIGMYDTIYVRERRRALNFSRDVRSGSSCQLEDDGSIENSSAI